MNEQHFKEIEVVMLYLGEARKRAEKAQEALTKMKAEPHLIEAVKRVDTGDGVAILTDMFGGTPSNLAISLMGTGHIEVIAGVNLPMLIRLASVRKEMDVAAAVEAAQAAGVKYISVASQILGEAA